MSNHETTNEKLTIIFAFRDRDLQRVERCLQSLAAQTDRRFKVNFVDYGSRPTLAKALRELVETFTFCQYVYVDTFGLIWNKSKALNIGIRLADSKYILNSDVDIIFAPNFVEAVLDVQDGSSVIGCSPYMLPEGFGDWDQIMSYAGQLRRKPMLIGTCQCYPLSVIQNLGGFDENLHSISEDRDLQNRLALVGLKEKRVDDQTATFHQWHPETAIRRSHSFRSNWLKPYFEQVKDQPVRNDATWGQMIGRSSRPLFDRFPLAKTEEVVDLPTFLNTLKDTINGQDAKTNGWFITDRPASQSYNAAGKIGYNCATISASWWRLLMQRADKLEELTEMSFSAAITRLKTARTTSPDAIVIDVATFWRISNRLFTLLLETLAPDGFLVITNLGNSCLPPTASRLGRVLAPILIQGCWRLRRHISAEARQRGQQMVTFFDNNLRDSLYLARIDMPSILDMRLDFPTAGVTVIFLKG